ncbi:MAG TPA: NAD(P)-dependent alcohol dehydrogenase [Microbacterium sp.]|uniref:NAD(P)-dependent alcohol dehydrogenase n=1 Tax=Microbacterium sp. TaxID=51671 RepID=UPI002D0471A9|nr:NAD(P)-dependent alcohol dehydrogenase [Microbacterium sp.]HWI30543.1 NAD(P)-dependent alcohol dehydrogenase [Microbacterium sp.]
MTTTTTAAVLRVPEGRHEFEEITLGDLGPGDVLVRIVGAGLCHTDMLPRGMLAGVLPAVLGHEGSGIVVDVGPGVDRVRPGDPVVLSFASCGSCRACESGHPAYCDAFFPLNLSARNLDGSGSAADSSNAPVGTRWFGQSSFARHAIVSERSAVAVDKDLPLELMGPLGCGIQTGAGSVLNVMNVQPGQSVVVFGAGAVGLAGVMAARLAGAGEIIAVDLHQSRLDLAVELGATRAVLASTDDLSAAVLGDAAAVDHALDTTAVGSVMELAITIVRPGGTVVFVGAGEQSITVHPTQLTGKNVTYALEGDADPQEFIPALIEHWRAGQFPFDRLVTTFPFDEINTAEAESLSGAVIKPVLVFGPHAD